MVFLYVYNFTISENQLCRLPQFSFDIQQIYKLAGRYYSIVTIVIVIIIVIAVVIAVFA